MLFLALMVAQLSLVAHANELTEILEPSFIAEKIEYNPITDSYIVVHPQYEFSPGNTKFVSFQKNSDLRHLCRFYGFSGGRYLSGEYGCANTVMVYGNGDYGDAYNIRSCWTISFLECKLR